MKILIQIYIIFILIISCKKENKRNFIPKIQDSIPTTVSILNTSKMLEGGFKIIGIQENGKHFEIKNLTEKNEEYLIKYLKYTESTETNENFENEEIIEINETEFPMIEPEPSIKFSKKPYEIGNDLEIYVDINQILNMPNYTENSEIVQKLEKGTNDVIEYSNTIKESYSKYYKQSRKLNQAFPVFIFNQSDSIISLDLKEDWFFMIQEAKNEKGKWKPIEYYEPYTYCGNSFWSKKLIPNHYAISKVYKYEGKFKTKLRLKFMTNNKIYYSNEFVSFINLKQFELSENILKKTVENRKKYFFNN
jgi:hypothetical protein